MSTLDDTKQPLGSELNSVLDRMMNPSEDDIKRGSILCSHELFVALENMFTEPKECPDIPLED